MLPPPEPRTIHSPGRARLQPEPAQTGRKPSLAETQLSATLVVCIAILRVHEPHRPSEPLNRLLTHSARPSTRGHAHP